MNAKLLLILFGMFFLVCISSVSAYPEPNYNYYNNCAAVPQGVRDEGGITRTCEEVYDCHNLETDDRYYLLMNNITSNMTCMFITADDSIFDLNSYTLTYGDTPVTGIPNSDFEQGTANWDLSGAPSAQIVSTSEMPFPGNYTLKFDNPSIGEEIISDWTYLPIADRTYYVYVHVKTLGDSYSHVWVEREGGEVMCNQSSNRFAHRGVAVFCDFKITQAGNYRLHWETEEAVTYWVALTGIRPGWDAGIALISYLNSYYFPDYVGYTPNTPINIIIRNGRIIQGRGKGVLNNGIYKSTAQLGTIENLYMESWGLNSPNFRGNGGANVILRDSVFVQHAPYAFGRQYPNDQGAGNIFFGQSGDTINVTIYNNLIIGGQGGIHSNAVDTAVIYNNTIKHDTLITNHYGIMFGHNFVVYDNYIEPISGDGMFIGGDNHEVYNNIINISTRKCNPEYYPGPSTPIMRISDYNNGYTFDNQIYNNTIYGYSKPLPNFPTCNSQMRGFFISTAGANNVYENNTIILKRLPGGPEVIGIEAAGDNVGIFRNNYIESDNHVLETRGSYLSVGYNGLFDSTTFVRGTDPQDYLTFEFIATATNHTFVNSTFLNGASNDDIYYGSSGNKDRTIKWYLDILALDGGSPAIGAQVTIVDNQSNVVFNNEPVDTNGAFQATLTEFFEYAYGTSTPTRDYYSPYNVTVTYGPDTISRNITLNQSKTEVFTFGNVTCANVNGDGTINIIDLVLVIFHQGRNSGQGDWQDYRHLDVVQDDVINFADVSAVISSFGQSC